MKTAHTGQRRLWAAIGFDIRDLSPTDANMFDNNLCLTYSGAATPAPCPNITRFAGHHNARPGLSQKP